MASLFDNYARILKTLGEGDTQNDHITIYEVSELSYIENSRAASVIQASVMGMDIFIDPEDTLFVVDFDPEGEDGPDDMEMYAMEDPELISDVRKMLIARLKMLAKWKF